MFSRVVLGVGGLAAAALMLESTLTRMLAVAQFYHFAFLVISLALLGFGASGSVLMVAFRRQASPDTPNTMLLSSERLIGFSSLGFFISVAFAYLVINLLPFDSYSIAWERRQGFLFGLYYLVLTLPFIFTGIAIGGALSTSRGRSHQVYAANLVGSGLGVLFAPVAMWLAGVSGAVLASALVGLLGTILFQEFGKGTILRRGINLILLIGLAGFTILSLLNFSRNAPLGMTISPYKGLIQALRYPGSSVLFGRWNAISRVDVVADAGTRMLPGLSYVYPGIPPPQYGLSIDADALQPITLAGVDEFSAADYMPEAIAFHRRPGARVLALETGGGLGVLQSLAGGASEIIAVVENPLILQGVETTTGLLNVYEYPRVQTIVETSRVFTRRDTRQYDIVYLPLTDAYRPVTSGAYSLSETYGLTVEAFESALSRLEPDGILVTTRWLQIPPSESLRQVATLATALDNMGVASPSEAIVAFRGVQTMTIMVQPKGWSPDELSAVRTFVQDKRYDMVWAPDIDPDETNRYNRLPESYYYQALNDMFAGEDKRSFYSEYPFAVQPPTDNRPFFFHFFKWAQTPELLAALGRTWQPFGGSGFFVLIALLVLVLFLSVLLIFAPLVYLSYSQKRGTYPWGRQKDPTGIPPSVAADRIPIMEPGDGITNGQVNRFSPGLNKWTVFFYFGLLGLAFLFVEIPLIQLAILLLGHPIYAFTVVVLAVLTFSGIGSLLAREKWLPRRWAFILLAILALLTPWLVRLLIDGALGWVFPLRAFVLVISLAPLAILMGIPFPSGLAWLEKASHGALGSSLVPWAWAINGCASVISAVLAAILALSYGFTAVLLLGAGAYSLAGVIYFRTVST